MTERNLLVSDDRLLAALRQSREDLLGAIDASGHWIGELASSAVSTATAISALSLVRRGHAAGVEKTSVSSDSLDVLIQNGVDWLAAQQNEDGGWGDTDLSHSNIATTMLAAAALVLSGRGDELQSRLDRADEYIDRLGRLDGLRARYGKDKTFAVPILTNAALAGRADWADISPLPFEMACVPQRFYRFLQLPVVSYAIPALVAVGQARHHHRPSWNPLVRALRGWAAKPSLDVLQRMQPASGGFLEATPLTSFVVMSLASIGKSDHPVVELGVEFLMESARSDGSWPIDTNLATFNTTLAINSLAVSGEDLSSLNCLDWLLSCQHRERHPFTGADPGGWGWTDLSGAVPDADDTPGALLALANWRRSPSLTPDQHGKIDDAASSGLRWLLDLRNRDGGWPTFCRGWGKLPFDRSGSDLTAHALRALAAWKPHLDRLPEPLHGRRATAAELDGATQAGLRYLTKEQRSDSSWAPLWFGNQDHPEEENPVYGTARVLLAYRDLGANGAPEALRGYQWLASHQNPAGGWGGGPSQGEDPAEYGSIEETAVALEALLGADAPEAVAAADRGLAKLVEWTESDRRLRCWPIGFYFAKLWYHERLYPLVFTLGALGTAASRRGLTRQHPPQPAAPAAHP